MTPLIVATDLCFCRNDLPVFSGIHLSVGVGQVLHIVGVNGVGKSTLLRVLAGLLVPDQGSIERAYLSSEVTYIGHRLGVKDLLTVGENVLEMGAMDSFILEKGKTLMKLRQLWDALAKDLSAGQRQRLALMKLFSPAKIWLLDEPLTALDKEGIEIFNQLLEKHCSEGGAAVIASHQTISAQNIPIKTLALGEREIVS